MGLKLVIPPLYEPIGLEEAKDFLRVDTTADDALIDAQIIAARRHCEDFTGRALMPQTWDWTLDVWPCDGVLRVPLAPFSSVASISYIDGGGASQAWAAENYQVAADPDAGRIALAYGKTFPTLRGGDLAAVTVRFVAGYASAGAIPQSLKQAILLLVAHWYHERRPVGVAQLAEMPFQVSALLSPYKLWGFGA
jgi:uncharacterized phiE125 gp8 family phage protein